MTDLVKQYLKLDREAVDAESQAEEWAATATDARWELCRIAHEAIESGEFVRSRDPKDRGFSGFARAIKAAGGKLSADTIRRQVVCWERYGSAGSRSRPTYGEAMAEASGETSGEGWARKDRSAARAALSNPETAAELLTPEVLRNVLPTALKKDPSVGVAVMQSVNKHHRENPIADPYANRKPVNWLEHERSQLEMFKWAAKFVETCNEARRSGYVRPGELREVAEKLHNYANAIEDVANSRGLTDEELAEFMNSQS